jgi:hypothetical protein
MHSRICYRMNQKVKMRHLVAESGIDWLRVLEYFCVS